MKEHSYLICEVDLTIREMHEVVMQTSVPVSNREVLRVW